MIIRDKEFQKGRVDFKMSNYQFITILVDNLSVST